jgi:hypothetical protein
MLLIFPCRLLKTARAPHFAAYTSDYNLESGTGKDGKGKAEVKNKAMSVNVMPDSAL